MLLVSAERCKFKVLREISQEPKNNSLVLSHNWLECHCWNAQRCWWHWFKVIYPSGNGRKCHPNCSLCLGSVLPLGQHRLRCHTEEAKMPVELSLWAQTPWRALCRFVIKSYLLNLALRLTHALRCFYFLAYLILHLPSVIYRNSLVSHSLHIRPLLFCMDLYPAQQVSFFSLISSCSCWKVNIKQYLLPRVSCALCCQSDSREELSQGHTEDI